MVKYISLLLFIAVIQGQPIDEIEILYSKNDKFFFQPESLYKSEGLWYTATNNEPATLRLQIYSKNNNGQKIVECTLVNGLKNGSFMQYYNTKEVLPGIMGLYVNDKKNGSWIWIEPDKIYEKQKWDNTDLQIMTKIDYRDGLKHGTIIVHKANMERFEYLQNYSYPRNDIILRGQYSNGKKIGEWYYYDYIYSESDWTTDPADINNMVDYWSRKYIYANNELIDSKCREPWGTEIDCESFEQKYYKNIYLIPDRDEVKKEPPAPIKPKDKVVIKDNNGVDVEIDIKEFTKHINEFHHIVTSIHQERGHYFTVNKRFRKMLNGKIEQ